jgi:hypothetical protein
MDQLLALLLLLLLSFHFIPFDHSHRLKIRDLRHDVRIHHTRLDVRYRSTTNHDAGLQISIVPGKQAEGNIWNGAQRRTPLDIKRIQRTSGSLQAGFVATKDQIRRAYVLSSSGCGTKFHADATDSTIVGINKTTRRSARSFHPRNCAALARTLLPRSSSIVGWCSILSAR